MTNLQMFLGEKSPSFLQALLRSEIDFTSNVPHSNTLFVLQFFIWSGYPLRPREGSLDGLDMNLSIPIFLNSLSGTPVMCMNQSFNGIR